MPSPLATSKQIREDLLEFDPYGTYQRRIQLFDNFKRRPVLAATLDPAVISQASNQLLIGANKQWSIFGTNAADAGSAILTFGGIQLTTAGGDDDQIMLTPADRINNVYQSPWDRVTWFPTKNSRFEAIVELPATFGDTLFQIGFGNTFNLDTTTDNNQAKLQYNTEGAVSTTNWTVVESVNNVDREIDTGIPVAFNEPLRIGLEINSSSVVRYWVNGIPIFTGETVEPLASLFPFMGMQALLASPRNYIVRAVRGAILLPAD